jgi:regulator of replication initiation timing
MAKLKMEQKRVEVIARERKEQEAAEWDKKLTSIGSQLSMLRDQAQTLEKSNQALTLENKKLKKQATYEPEVTYLYMESKKEMKSLLKENEELKSGLETLRESLPIRTLKSQSGKSDDFLADVRATIAESKEMVRESRLNSPKQSKPGSATHSPMASVRRGTHIRCMKW